MKSRILVAGKKAYPSVSIIIPTDKRYPHFKNEEEKMKSILKRTSEMLMSTLPEKKAGRMISDLYRLASKIDYKRLSDGLGLFISPYREGIHYFPFAVKEKVVVGRTFEMRDLVMAAKNNFRHAILTISEKQVRVFVSDTITITEERIPEMPYGMHDVGGKGHQRVGVQVSASSHRHASDKEQHKEVLLGKYLLEIDRVITQTGWLRDLPLIICGSKRLTGHFNELTRHGRQVLGSAKGNYENASKKKIVQAVRPVLAGYLQKREDEVLALLEKESRSKRVASGIDEVHRAASDRRGHLLVVERNYSAQGVRRRSGNILRVDGRSSGRKVFVPNVVDDLLEKVIHYGGDVEFVTDGRLADHGRIALIMHY